MRFSIVQVVLVQGVVLDLSVECFELPCFRDGVLDSCSECWGSFVYCRGLKGSLLSRAEKKAYKGGVLSVRSGVSTCWLDLSQVVLR